MFPQKKKGMQKHLPRELCALVFDFLSRTNIAAVVAVGHICRVFDDKGFVEETLEILEIKDNFMCRVRQIPYNTPRFAREFQMDLHNNLQLRCWQVKSVRKLITEVSEIIGRESTTNFFY